MRDTNGFLKKHVASLLDVDIAHYSNIECNEKHLSKHHLNKLTQLFILSEKELLSLWLSDKVMHEVNDEYCAADVFVIALNELKRE